MASDFHTHTRPAPGVKALISASRVQDGDVFTSLELHPWNLPSSYMPEKINITGKLADFHALGEVGLDKLRGPSLEIQQKYLMKLLEIAADMNKPVILHIVKSYQEIFALLKKFNLRLMVHGFCGSPELLDELWKRQITVSFPEKILSRQELINKLAKNSGAYGFESDDRAGCDVRNILKNCGIQNVEHMTDQYFADFLRI